MRDQYKPGRVLGKGSYGVVLNCVECSSGNAYACKSVAIAPLLATPDGQNVVARLRSELGVMGYLAGHPNICRLHDFYESPSHLFIVQARVGSDRLGVTGLGVTVLGVTGLGLTGRLECRLWRPRLWIHNQ